MAESSGRAFVTLATNDSYCVGALVMGASLKRVNTTASVVCMITPSVSNSMRQAVSQVFDQVCLVNILDSRDTEHLNLLERPDLGVTFTKLHCWRLDHFTKCVFLDADTLVLKNCDELFEREEFSAAPDPGWPDCFNSGVFVYVPSKDTYSKLIDFAKTRGSFDGGDQGLLNLYYSNWAHTDIHKHLPFTYNVVSQAFYSYLPAFRQFGANTKICHFIGAMKPWHHRYNESAGSPVYDVSTGFSSDFLNAWWQIFRESILPLLPKQSVGSEESAYSKPDDQMFGTESYTPTFHRLESSEHSSEQTSTDTDSNTIHQTKLKDVVDRSITPINSGDMPAVPDTRSADSGQDSSSAPRAHHSFNAIMSHIQSKIDTDNETSIDIYSASPPSESPPPVSDITAGSKGDNEDDVMPQLSALAISTTSGEGRLADIARRERWERGVADYTGEDSFDSIRRHLDSKLSAASNLTPSADVKPKTSSLSAGAATSPSNLPQLKPKKSALKKPRE